eukprot:GHVU01101973.1.p1 GENE.GHVU01101973.1~~GHVU01101973.1.p1  ORF type:complete len:1087 (-),score=147.50 GHVU01101973.1:168-3428(-)
MFSIDHPFGGPKGELPYIYMSEQKQEENVAPAATYATLSLNQVKGWHTKMLDAGRDTLRETLAERKLSVKPSDINQVLEECTACYERNAVTPTLPSSTSLRADDKSFNDIIVWDLLTITEVSKRGNKYLSVMRDGKTMWLEVKPLGAKSEAPLALSMWIGKHGPMKVLRSDCAPELKRGKTEELCIKYNIDMPPSPPHTSGSQGIAERANRQIRSCLRTLVARKLISREHWDLAAYGVAEIMNTSWSRAIGCSPYMSRFAVAPPVSPTVGELVSYKPPQKNARKMLTFPGRTAMYMGCINPQTAVLLDGGCEVHVHPTALRVHKDSVENYWCKQYSSYPPCPPQRKHTRSSASQPVAEATRTRPMLLCEYSLGAEGSSSSDSSDSEATYQIVTRGRARRQREEPQAAREAQVPVAAQAEGAAEDVQDVSEENDNADGGEGNADGGEGTDGSVLESPRLSPRGFHDERSYVLVIGHDRILRAAHVVKTRQGSVDIALLEQDDEWNWQPSNLEFYIPTDRIHTRFALINATIPEHIVRMIGTSADREEQEDNQISMYTCVAATPKGRGMQRPACKNDVDEGKYEAAMQREWVTLLQNEVIGDFCEVPSKTAMKTKFHLTEKEDPVSGVRRYKARLVVKGFMDPKVGETYAATPATFPTLIALTCIISQDDWDLKLLDVKSAFLQAKLPVSSEARVKFDGKMPELPEMCPFADIPQEEYDVLRAKAATVQPGGEYKLKAALYGWKKAPLVWSEALASELRALGLSEVEEGIWVGLDEFGKLRCVLVSHSDDLAIGEKKGECTEKRIAQKFECNPCSILQDGKSVKFLGINMRKEKGKIFLSLDHYLNESDLDVTGKVKRVVEKDLAPGSEEEIDLSLIPEYRSAVGLLGWVVKLRPDQMVFYSEFSRHSMCPTRKHLDALRRCMVAIRKNPEELELRAVKNVAMVVFFDASFSNVTKMSRRGYKVFLAEAGSSEVSENLVAWCSRSTKRLVDSSTSAELLALKLTVKHLFSYVGLVEVMWQKKVSIIAFTDSRCLYDQIRTSKLAEERALRPELDYVLQELRRLGCKVEWCERAKQKADSLTKLVWFDP